MLIGFEIAPLFRQVVRWITPQHGSSPGYWMSVVLLVALTLFAVFVAHRIGRLLFVGLGRRLVERTETQWDDLLITRGFFSRVAHLLPAAVVYLAGEYVYPDLLRVGVTRVALGYFTLVGIGVSLSVLDIVKDIYRSFESARKNPIAGFVGGAKVVVVVMGVVILISALLGKDPWALVAGIGALMAVLLLIFKDSILGLVASIQILANDLVDLDDWIEVPSHGADGTVMDISLTTLKVQNFDKTIVSVPTYALISGSFKNWRGMSQSGARRIKRSLRLDMNSIRFCDEETLDGFERIELIRDYVKERRAEIAKANDERGYGADEVANGRRMTNVGTFRAYVRAFVQAHPKVRPDMTRIVRQLAPTSDGLPIELYLFSADTDWTNYEDLQSDIFDHLFAVLPRFGLRVFQHPTGADFSALNAAVAGA